jgi:uncharacterized protein YdeI (YjbR/CyaY-like superfamily)
MEMNNSEPTFYAEDINDWRKWLEKNCQSEKSIWLIIYRNKSKTPSLHFQEAIEHALCFGWIDSLANKRDDESFLFTFHPKKSKK